MDIKKAVYNDNSNWIIEILQEANKKEIARIKKMHLLHLASQYLRSDAAKTLIDYGIPVNEQDEKGRTPLMLVVKIDSDFKYISDMITILLKGRSNINIKDNAGVTALMMATDEGFTETMQMLINSGAKVNLTDNKGRTALMRHLEYDGVLTEPLKILVNAGAIYPSDEFWDKSTTVWSKNDFLKALADQHGGTKRRRNKRSTIKRRRNKRKSCNNRYIKCKRSTKRKRSTESKRSTKSKRRRIKCRTNCSKGTRTKCRTNRTKKRCSKSHRTKRNKSRTKYRTKRSKSHRTKRSKSHRTKRNKSKKK